MARFILRYKGSGSKPQEDVARIRALAQTTVLNESDRMLLVAAPEAELRALMGSLPDWVMSAEKTLTLPDPRPRILRGPKKNR